MRKPPTVSRLDSGAYLVARVDTQAYTRAVAIRLGVHPTEPIDIKNPATLRRMVVGIIVHENGGNPYSAAVIDGGVRRALV